MQDYIYDANGSENPVYRKGDSAYGTVSSNNRSGAYIDLDNGQYAFSFNAGNVKNDSRIICTVVRPATEGRRCLVALDCVCDYYEIA